MGKILCATRGGEASIHTQEAAIRRSKESGDELIFFYVVDVEFMAQADYALRTDLASEEMEKMGEFLLLMAVERAQKRAVEARHIIRRGRFLEELEAVIEEEEITFVVLGRPAEDTRSAFNLARLQKLAENLQEETGVEVWLPE